MIRPVPWVIVIAVVAAAIDQWTKWLVIRQIHPADEIAVIDGLFRLVHWRNSGAAWGVLRDHNWILTVISVAALVALVIFRRSLHLESKACRWAVGLIAGGIIGNVIDRVRWGAVVDFLDFYIGEHHWPAFNVADSCICVGVGLYILMSWRLDKANKDQSA